MRPSTEQPTGASEKRNKQPSCMNSSNSRQVRIPTTPAMIHEQVIRMLQHDNIVPGPEVYHIMWHVCARRNPDLVADVMDLLQSGLVLDNDAARRLHLRHLGLLSEEDITRLASAIRETAKALSTTINTGQEEREASLGVLRRSIDRIGEHLKHIADDHHETARLLQRAVVAVTIIEKSHDHLRNMLQNAREELDRVHRELEQAQQAATTDYLTGIPNRRGILENLEERLKAGKFPFCAAILDIDHFKSINDTYGHDIGDDALVLVANRIRHLWPANDRSMALGRLGGEEFLLLTNMSEKHAMGILTDVIRKIGSQPIRIVRTEERILPITISGGLVEVTSDLSGSMVLSQADRALYLAKRRGRNRIERGCLHPTGENRSQPEPDAS